ncbi:MAG: thiamine-phosphate kinase [Armatimonadia bacterium]
MRLHDLGEFGFIDSVRRFTHCSRADVILAIGDDCAVIETSSGDRLAVTTDAMLEGRHFRLDWLTPYQVGSRAMTACLSDVAAMGAEPCFAFVSTALPPRMEVEEAENLVRGVVDQAERFGACLLGGDTIAAHEHVGLDIILLGRCREHIWRRDGACVGDVLAVTGDLGGSAAAVAAKSAGLEGIPCWHRYAAPVPRVAQAAALNSLGAITACLDVSDGLVQDAGHLCERSGVGIAIRAGLVPISEETRKVAQDLRSDPLTWALTGGEDFELLFTAPAEAMPELQDAAGIALTVVGEVVPGSEVVVTGEDDQPLALQSGGWNHFGARS